MDGTSYLDIFHSRELTQRGEGSGEGRGGEQKGKRGRAEM